MGFPKFETNDEITEDDIDRVIDWCHKGREYGSHYRGMSYEDGVIAAIDWLTGNVEEAPDAE